MSALPARGPAAGRAVPGSIAAAQWAQIRAAAPQVVVTIQRYLQRLAAFLAPGSVDAAENALRQFARWMITDAGLEHATCHELRHTCLTRLREAGMALEAVQAQAGHASIESTRVYLHLANDWLAGEYLRAAALIDADTAAVGEMLAAQEGAAR